MSTLATPEVAVVTGAAQGIGEATARALAALGRTVVASDISADGVKRVSDELRAAGQVVDALTCDVNDEAAVARLIGHAVDTHGRLDILVNTAAWVDPPGPVHGMSLDVWQRSLGTNLQGTFLTCKHALHHMLGRDSGSIVNLSSINGLHGFPNRASYAASKAGVVNLTQTIAAEVEGTGIRVNAICPARVDTPRLRALAAGYAEAHQKPLDEVITDFGFNSDKVMSADDVAGVITFLTTTNLGRWFNGQALVMGWA